MKTIKEEYLGLLCKFYLVILLAVLPLYMQDGYYLLGDGKYTLFRNCSLLCIGIWVAMEIVSVLYSKINGKSAENKITTEKGEYRWGAVDIFMLAYGGCVLLSAICSRFDAAWLGYADWYMGAVSQLIFVGIYFLVSRYFCYDRFCIYVAEGALFAVILVALAARLGFDWLGVYQGLSETDWVCSNMLSTIGNINWLCGYFSVVLAVPISGYLYGKGKLKTGILYLVSVLGFLLLVIQGSDSGPVLAAVALGLCLIAGMKKTQFFKRGLLLFGGTAMGVYGMGWGITFLNAWNFTPGESWIYGNMAGIGWLVIGILAFLFWVLCAFLEEKGKCRVVRRIIKVVILAGFLVGATIAIFLVCTWSKAAPETFGSGRGVLWKLALEGFEQADVKGKIIGAGPDCFAEYLISIGKPPIITQEDHWANALFVNAHNEWLNHLVNLGILGVVSYGGIFIAAWKRYKGMMLAVLMLAMYGVHSLVSFQQVLNAPLLFAVLGICESQIRRNQVKK